MSVARVYYAPLVGINVTTSADQDIWELTPPATDRKVILHGFSLTSTTTSDERVSLRLVRRSTAGSGGTGVTEVKSDPDNGTAPGAALVSLATTPGTLGDVLAGWQWSQLGELLFLPTPEIRPCVAAGGHRLALHLGTAVGSARTWSGYVVWEEI